MSAHRIVRLLVAAAAAAALAGCATDRAPTAAPSPAGTATVSPMPTPPPPSARAGLAPAAPLTSAELNRALLQPATLGSGYEVDTSPGANDTADVYRDCPRLLRGTRPPLAADARRDFRKGDEGPFVTEQLVSGSAEQLRSALAELRSAVAGCHELTLSQEDGEDIRLVVQARSSASATVAFSVTATDADFGLDVAAAATGRGLALITQIGYGGVDPALTDRVLREAVRALR